MKKVILLLLGTLFFLFQGCSSLKINTKPVKDLKNNSEITILSAEFPNIFTGTEKNEVFYKNNRIIGFAEINSSLGGKPDWMIFTEKGLLKYSYFPDNEKNWLEYEFDSNNELLSISEFSKKGLIRKVEIINTEVKKNKNYTSTSFYHDPKYKEEYHTYRELVNEIQIKEEGLETTIPSGLFIRTGRSIKKEDIIYDNNGDFNGWRERKKLTLNYNSETKKETKETFFIIKNKFGHIVNIVQEGIINENETK